jgi:CheY-like chemotaxis protein
LPACAETASGAEAPTLETDRLRGQETLLLVENDDSIRRLAAAQLKRAGYRVIEASQASEALQIAVVDKGFPLLLTDLSMPGMGGLERARKLRAARPGLKVLFVSGSPPENTEQPLLQGPGTDFLAKPYASPELLRRIRALLDQALP